MAQGNGIGLIGPGFHAGDSGGQVGDEERFSDAGVSDEEGELGERDPSGPKPGDGVEVEPVGAGEGGVGGSVGVVRFGFEGHGRASYAT